jgi:cytochrome c oxidase subunit 2
MNVRSKYRLGAALVGALAATTLLAGCVNNATFIDPQGPVALAESNLFWFIFYVATFVFIAVTSVLLISIVRFRARPGLPAPRQLHGNTTIELIWTVVPSLILFSVLGITIYTLFSIGEPANANALTVRVIGHQWWWEFQYSDNGGFTTADEMHIPVGRVVHVELRSNNVIHSFWVPQLGGKRDVVPGRLNRLIFTADTPGEYRGQCAEFCGVSHANMGMRVIVDAPDAFARWVAAQKAEPAEPAGLAAEGKAIFSASACVGCHTIRGVSSGALGPDLTTFGSRHTLAAGLLPATVENVAAWLKNPPALKPDAKMPALGLTDDQARAVATYLIGLK